MTVTNEFSEQSILESWKGELDLENDNLKAILMVPAFTFNPTTHATYSDVSASEIADGNGYTTGGVLLTNVSLGIESGVTIIDCDNISWAASGGAIADAGALIIYDDSHSNDTIIMCITYGATYSTAIGTSHLLDCSNGLGAATPNPT